MSMGHDLKAAADEKDVFRRLKAAAVAVVDEYDGMRDQMFLGQKVDGLRAVLLELAPAPMRPTTVWDIDPRKHFGRVAGKVVATITEQDDGTWEMTTDDGRTWPKFRTPEQARLAFDSVPARKSGWEWVYQPLTRVWDLRVDGKLAGTVDLVSASRRYEICRLIGGRLQGIGGTLPTVNNAKAHLLFELDLITSRQFDKIRAGTEVEWKSAGGGAQYLNIKGQVVGCVHELTNGNANGYVLVPPNPPLSIDRHDRLPEAKEKAEEMVFDLVCKAVLPCL